MEVTWQSIPSISDLYVRRTPTYIDERGHFQDIFSCNNLPIEYHMLQSSISYSKNNVLRGMHAEAEQTQIVTIIEGRVLEIVLKIDMYTERQIQMHSMILDSEENNQILLPRGAFHGYHVLSDKAIIHYSSDTLYMPVNQLGVNWKSRQLIDVWGDIDPLVSNRDYTLPQIDLFIQNNSRSNP